MYFINSMHMLWQWLQPTHHFWADAGPLRLGTRLLGAKLERLDGMVNCLNKNRWSAPADRC